MAVGVALGDKMQGRPSLTACFFGDGAVDEGEFHESMNLAELWSLPVLFVCENNLYSMGMALARAEAETDIARKAAAYRMPAAAVDGMDVVAVEAAARNAVDAIRAGGGPQFPRMPHLSVPRPFDVRRPALPHKGRGRGLAQERADRAVCRPGCGRTA